MKHGLFFIIITLGLFVSCAEADVIGPRGSKDAPAQVKIRNVVNEAGRSIIYYNLPEDNNFKYVKAIYEPRPGVTSETKASYYTDSLIVEGFKNEGDYTVKLYSVSSGEAMSDPLDVQVSPLRPPYLVVSEGAKILADFGGFKFLADNPSRERLYYTVQVRNAEGEWETVIETSSENKDLLLTKRGLESVETTARFFIEDYWGNQSDPIEFSFVPYEEIACDKSLWKYVIPPGESQLIFFYTSKIEYAWDGKIFTIGQDSFQIASNTYQYPVTFTIDLGETYYLDRFEMWPCWQEIIPFQFKHLKDFELYGAETLDMDDPLFDDEGNLNPNWTPLFKGTWARASGSPYASSEVPLTEEEEEIYNNGIPYSFDLINSDTKVRYFKMRTLSDWSISGLFCITDMSLYGMKAE